MQCSPWTGITVHCQHKDYKSFRIRSASCTLELLGEITTTALYSNESLNSPLGIALLRSPSYPQTTQIIITNKPRRWCNCLIWPWTPTAVLPQEEKQLFSKLVRNSHCVHFLILLKYKTIKSSNMGSSLKKFNSSVWNYLLFFSFNFERG